MKSEIKNQEVLVY